MRLTYLLVVILLANVQTAFAEDWLSHYYEHPMPERFVTEVHALSKAGNLSNQGTAALISVFLGTERALGCPRHREQDGIPDTREAALRFDRNRKLSFGGNRLKSQLESAAGDRLRL
jgi:hypothetical protein